MTRKTTYKKLLEKAAETNDEMMVAVGYDDCVIGLCRSYYGTLLLYDEKKIIEKLKKEMTEEEAWEFYEYNIIGTYAGVYTPVYLSES